MRRARRFIVVLTLALVCASASSAQKSGDGELRIEVRDVAGHALERACVTVVPRVGEIFFRQCNRRGTVVFKGLAPGSYRVVVKSNGYEAQKREVVFDSNTGSVAFSLSPRKL